MLFKDVQTDFRDFNIFILYALLDHWKYPYITLCVICIRIYIYIYYVCKYLLYLNTPNICMYIGINYVYIYMYVYIYGVYIDVYLYI